MRRVIRASTAVLVITPILISSATAAEATDVTGTWSRSGTLQNGQVVVTSLVLKQDGEKVRGTWESTGAKPEEIKDGRISKDEISFHILTIKAKGPIEAVYVGKVKGETMEIESQVDYNGQVRKGAMTLKRVAR